MTSSEDENETSRHSEVMTQSDENSSLAATKALGDGISFATGTGSLGVLSRFEIIEQVGRGGFGIVYRARDLELNRDVAVKVARPEQVATAEGIARFRREADPVHTRGSGKFCLGRAQLPGHGGHRDP